MGYILLGICGYVIYKILVKRSDSAETKPCSPRSDTGKCEMDGSDVGAYFLLEEFIDRPRGSRHNDSQNHLESIQEIQALDDPDFFDDEDEFIE